MAEAKLRCPNVRVVPRFAIWELHGAATEQSVRNIDDCLAGGQNDACGTQFYHRPLNLDTWGAQTRAAQERFPNVRLAGFPIEFRGTYRHAAACPLQAVLLLVGM